MRRNRLLILPGALAFLLAAPLCAVSAGTLLLTTSTLDNTRLEAAVPADFFGAGSDPMLNINLILRGEPLGTQTGTPSLGSTDTILRLKDSASFSLTQPQSLTIPTHIQALNLVSAVPLVVTYNHGASQELWDVRVCLSSFSQIDGSITLTNDCRTSGTFVSKVSVRPRVIFSRISDRLHKALDEEDETKVVRLDLVATGFWVNRSITSGEILAVPIGSVIDKNCDGRFDSTMVATSDIALGVARVGCNWLFPNQGYLALRPITQTVKDVQVVQPTLSAGQTFPLEGEQ